MGELCYRSEKFVSHCSHLGRIIIIITYFTIYNITSHLFLVVIVIFFSLFAKRFTPGNIGHGNIVEKVIMRSGEQIIRRAGGFSMGNEVAFVRLVKIKVTIKRER